MSDEDKKEANEKIDDLVPTGATNIYGACKFAVNQVLNRADKSRNPHILFFTDG